MTRSRRVLIAVGAVALTYFVSGITPRHVTGVVPVQGVRAPMFEVDPLWPEPLPNHWLLGSATGVAVDARGRVLVIHRNDIGGVFNARTEVGAAANPPGGECCLPAPNVLEFDADGNLVAHWGGAGEGYKWPTENQRLALESNGTVWIGGVGEGDAHILKFGRDGKFVGQLGTFNRVADVSIDANAREVYVADMGNRRVAVLDLATGAVKRSWGGYGQPAAPGDVPAYQPNVPAARQFRNVHCVTPASDDRVYVCDRESNRIQIFRKNGTFVQEKVIAPQTRGTGAVWDIALSHDPQQQFMYVADGTNHKVHVLNRQSLEVLTTFGTGGRQPGQFFALHSVAVDARGNLYTAETGQGKRVQKFVFKGIGDVTRKDQGVLWPRR